MNINRLALFAFALLALARPASAEVLTKWLNLGLRAPRC